MRSAIAVLTAALVFIHSVFGCCWHHAHDCEHGLASAVNPPVKCCQQHSHDSDGHQQPRPCPRSGECEGTCNFVAPQKVRLSEQVVAAYDIVATLPAVANSQTVPAAGRELGRLLAESALPLRTHLLHQVLLI